MRVLASVFLLALFAACSGCGSAPTSAATDDHHDAEHDDSDHHDDHVHHHHEVEHRPDDFADAVRAARRRHGIVLEELEEGHVDHLEHEVEELLDVIDWLPEFAADSDMRKAPWDRVHAASQKLRSSYAVVEEKLAEGETPTREDVAVEDAESALEELESLVGTEKGDSK